MIIQYFLKWHYMTDTDNNYE